MAKILIYRRMMEISAIGRVMRRYPLPAVAIILNRYCDIHAISCHWHLAITFTATYQSIAEIFISGNESKILYLEARHFNSCPRRVAPLVAYDFDEHHYECCAHLLILYCRVVANALFSGQSRCCFA